MVSGQSSEKERGIAAFLAFLAAPSTQKLWYESTGYLPLQASKYHVAHDGGYTILDIAALDLNQKRVDHPVVNGPLNQIRTIEDQMLEAIFAGLMSTQDAMNKAEMRANHALVRFLKNTYPPTNNRR